MHLADDANLQHVADCCARCRHAFTGFQSRVSFFPRLTIHAKFDAFVADEHGGGLRDSSFAHPHGWLYGAQKLPVYKPVFLLSLPVVLAITRVLWAKAFCVRAVLVSAD